MFTFIENSSIEMENLRDIEMLTGLDEFKKIFNEYLEIPIENKSVIGSYQYGQSLRIEIQGPLSNRNLVNTKYYFNDSDKVLHFTSFKSLFSIISEKSVRLYNLQNSIDKEEYNYIFEKIKTFFLMQGYNEDEIRNRIKSVKDGSFIFSCTSCEEVKNPKFWKEYASNGEGVGLEFEIINDPIKWERFYCSKVKYGELSKWDQLTETIRKNCNRNPSNTYDFNFDMIFCFHKKAEQKYIAENEIRILGQSHTEFDDIFYSLINPDIGKDGITPVQYLKLPLFVEDNNKLDFRDEIRSISQRLTSPNISGIMDQYFGYKFPKLKLTKIYLCLDFIRKHGFCEDLEGKIRIQFFRKFGYRIEIEKIIPNM